jgi:hypothetical protein
MFFLEKELNEGTLFKKLEQINIIRERAHKAYYGFMFNFPERERTAKLKKFPLRMQKNKKKRKITHEDKPNTLLNVPQLNARINIFLGCIQRHGKRQRAIGIIQKAVQLMRFFGFDFVKYFMRSYDRLELPFGVYGYRRGRKIFYKRKLISDKRKMFVATKILLAGIKWQLKLRPLKFEEAFAIELVNIYRLTLDTPTLLKLRKFKRFLRPRSKKLDEFVVRPGVLTKFYYLVDKDYEA